MLFETPELHRQEEQVLNQIRELWSQLAWQLKSNPYRWNGFLRRSSFARAIRGSNSIEGIEVSQQDALAAADHTEPFDSEGETWDAIVGYRDAMTYVLRLAEDPHFRFDASLIRSLHFMMLRYDLPKHPGAWRPGAIFFRDERRGEVVYEGPDSEQIPDLIDELVAWLGDGLRNESDPTSSMLRAAMAHLNLVLIHPFSDGNGRMARCLQTLVLARAGVLDPTFCSIEEYLGRNTDTYYAVLAEVAGGSFQPARDARPWIRLNLTAHFRQATTTLQRQREIALIWEEVEAEAMRSGLPERACASLVEAAFGYRVRNPSYREHTDVSALVASRDLKLLVEAGLLETVGERRGRYYVASERLRDLRTRHARRSHIADPFDDAAREGT